MNKLMREGETPSGGSDLEKMTCLLVVSLHLFPFLAE